MAGTGTTRDIRTRLTVEGEKQLKQALSENASEARKLKSDMDLLTAEFDGNTDSQEYLAKKSELVQAQMDNARRKVELYEQKLEQMRKAQQAAASAVEKSEKRLGELDDALEKTADQYGDNSEEAEKLRQQIREGNAVLENQRSKLSSANTALNKMETTTNKAKESLVKMGNASEKSAKQINKTEKAADESSASNKLLNAVLSDLSKKYGVELPESATTAMTTIGMTAGSIGLAIGVVTAAVKAAVDATKAWVDNAIEQSEWANDLEKMAAQTNINVERFQALQQAAVTYGVEADKITDSNKDLGQALANAADETSDEAAAFRRLGIAVKDSHGQIRENGEVWEELIDKLSRVTNSSERAQIANTLIGESYYELAPLLEDSAGYFEAVAKAQKSSTVLSEDEVKALNDLNAGYKTLQAALDGVKRALAAQSAEDLNDAMERLSETINKIGDYVIDSGMGEAIGALLEYIVAQLDFMVKLLDPDSAKGFFDAVTQGLKLATVGLDTLNKAIKNIVNNDAFKNLMNGIGMMLNPGMAVSSLGDSLSKKIYNSRSPRGHAAGTPYFRGGETIVGEYGPERVILPEGTRIQNANDTAAVTQGATVYNTINISVPDLPTLQKVVEFYSNYELTRRKM